MNYLKELKAFKDWLLVNDLPAHAIVLWYTLMALNNSVGWKPHFNAPNSVVGKLSGLSKSRLHEARKRLIEANFITCENGKKGKAPVYNMISLLQRDDQSMGSSRYQYRDPSTDRLQDQFREESQNQSQNASSDQSQYKLQNEPDPQYRNQSGEPSSKPLQNQSQHQSQEHVAPKAGESQDESQNQSDDPFCDQSGYQSQDKSQHPSRTIPKQKQREERRGDPHVENPFALYQKYFGTLHPSSKKAFTDWCDKLGNDMMIAAIKHAVKHGGRSFRYIEKILQEWTDANLHTVADVEKYVSRKSSWKGAASFQDQIKANNKAVIAELREEGWA
ncbi:DnaD domain-containing protein [Lentibacillus sp. Marseille-P4043]|uniref:DnaD domain-containing protein n=1 Tax=Lentibacillus sp. Marseille-P4043 TaxID=2040293 RepID=UPI000D0AEDCF|nr:DnaD domain protein [Lentibacillus sp. Marseille-P4043]